MNLADQPRPGPAESQGGSLSLPGALIRRNRREPTARLAEPPRAIGVPAVIDRGLLLGIGDVRTDLGEERQGLEDPEVGPVVGLCSVPILGTRGDADRGSRPARRVSPLSLSGTGPAVLHRFLHSRVDLLRREEDNRLQVDGAG